MGELLEQWKKKKNSNNTTSTESGSLLDEWRESKKYKDVDTSGVNDAYFESYNQAANSFFSNKELREGSYDQWQALNNQADTIRAWAWQNRDKLGSNYDKIMSATDLSEAGQYWNQFKTAEDYAKEYGSYASYNEMMNADLGALEDEISAMEGRINDLKYVERNGYHFGDNSIHAARKDRKQAEQDVAAKRAYYNEAKNLQAGKAYAEQARLDPEFANISANGAVIAPDGRRIENWVAYYRDPKNYDKTASFSTGHYMDNDQTESLESIAGRQMTDDEFATYNYLLGKGDKKAADAYLKSLEYQLNQREASSIAANLKGRPIAEVAWAIPTGLDQFGSGINSAISSIAGNDGYITPSSIQMSSGMVREDLSDYGFKVFGSSVGQIAYDTLNTTANMAPSILAATAVNMVAPGAGAYVGAGLMGLSAGGNAYAEALNNGYSKDNARAYGLFVGASEAALQSVLGGISSMAGAANISEEVLIGKANAINKALLRVAAKYGIKIGSETVEEELQNFLEPLFRTIFLGEEYDLPTIEELVQTALVTALSTGALESGGIVSSDIGTNKYYKDTYGGSQNELVAEGLELDPQSRYFQRLDEKLHRGKDLTGNEIRNVVTRNDRAIRNLGEAEVAVEQAETEAKQIAPETAQNAPKIAQERTEVTAEQTVAKTENKADAESATAKATPNNENVQEQLAKASKEYGKQAKAMVANYIEGQDVAEYSAAFRIAYDMGASGVKLSYVEGMDSYLTASQRKIAYEAGKASQDMRAKTIDKNNQKAPSGGTVRKKGAVRGDGVSIDDLTKRFNDTQRSAYTILSTIAEVTGIDIVLYKSEADAKGNFTDAQGKYKKSEPGTLYIDINAGLNNIKSAGDLANYTMLRTFSHEFVHFIENWNPVWYNELRRVVFDHIENADELIAREAAESGLPYERASREVVAEALTDILPDTRFIEDLANNHKNIFEKLLEKLKEFVASIKSHLATLTPNTNKGAQQLKESGKYFEDIVKLYDKVATEAVENYQRTVAEQKAETVKEKVKAEPKEKSLYEKYSDIKAQHPDSIVLYRVGDFYEILGEDAKVASEAADLTLSGRNDPVHGRVSMVGFPYRTVGAYAEKLRTVSRVAIVEEDGNVIEMSKTEAQQTDQEKPPKAKKPKKIASTEAVIPEESADAAQVEQEIAKSDVTVEQAKKNLKKAVTMPIQGTNEEALLAGIRSKELTFDMVSYHGNYPGFSPVQRAHLVEKLIDGVYTDDKVIKIDVPYDGKFEINNTPEIVASALHTLKVRVPQEIVWDKKAFTHFKNVGRVAVMKHGGQDYITDGGLMLPITDAAAKIATRELRADFRDYPKGFDKLAENATVPLTNAPFEAEIKGNNVYVFDVGGEKVYFDKKRFAFIDGGMLTYAKGEKFSVIKSVNEDGSLIGYLINVRSPKTDIEDGKPTKLKSFSKKKGAKGEVQYSRRSYAEQDQAYMDAVESGDMETAHRMVDDAAREAGYVNLFYHGAKKGGGFTVFRDWSYFTENKAYAERYADREKPSSLYHTYVKLENAFDTRRSKDRKLFTTIKQEYGLSDLQDTGLPDWTDGYDISDFIDENDLDYDGIVLDEGGDLVKGKPVSRGLSYVVRNSAQIKSADPVTYDDDGNVIPLSERFNEAEDDIRYQRRANYASGLTSGNPGEGMSYEVSVKDYTLKEVANMYHLGNLGAEYDALFDKVYAVCENIGITFDVVPIIRNEQGNEVPGVNTGDQVSFNVRSFNSTKVDNEYKSKVILHEMLHAATTYALRKYADKRRGATVNMPKNIYDSCAEMERVFNAIKNNPLFKNEYGIKNGKEMIAELSNPDFVEKLKATYPSAWHGLLDQICKLFGINKSFTNYDKLKKAVDEILAHPDYKLAKEHFALVDQNATYLDESQYADADVQEQRMREDTDASYMAAVEDGDTETLQHMVEKAAREAGFDSPKLYHGTNTFGFTSIDTKKSNDRVSFFATDSLEAAGTYSGTNRVREIGEQSASSLGIYQFYANTEGMLETDADGAESNHIKLDGIEKKFNDFMMTKSWKTHATAKQLAKYAKQSGYSGVIIKNVIDTATPDSRKSSAPASVYVFFDPKSQVKSADTVTYDDDGNVVPLSERFSSESTDIRYQRRDGRMTDQEVLAYAVDMYESDPSSMAFSDAEKNAFELFKQRLAKLDDLTEQRYEQGQIYRENTFQKGGDRELAQKAHNRMAVLDKQIERASAQLLDVQEKTVLQGVLQKARKVVEQAETKRGDEKLKRWRERRQEAASIKKYCDRILADRDELINWLNHPLNKDATKHINDNVKASVIQFLLTIDTSSKQKLSGRGATKADEKHVKQAQKLMEMLNGLDDEVRYSGDYDLPLNFNDRLQRHIKAVEDLLESYDGDTVLNIMNVDELQDLSVLTANLKTALTTLNKFHTNAMFAHVSTAGDNTVRYLRKMGDSDGSKGENFLMWKNIRPAYVWERFGDGGVSVEQALRRGQGKLAWNAKEIIDYAKATFTKEERKDWEEGAVTVSISDNREIRVTVAALMSFYELSKRAQGRAHILSGGVTVSDVEIRENKKKRRIKGRYGKFTEADIDAMNAKLTDHQKEVADKLQQFMEKRGGEWGNHVTLARFGEKAFGEKGYFPISVDKQSLSTNNGKNVKGADLYRLLNMGFTKELSSNTEQPVVLYSIFDVFSTHMADMAQYNAMALPVLDAIRWLNYKHFEFEGDARVEKSNLRAELRRVYGAPVSKGGEVLSGYAESFIAHILQAYNGTEAQGTPGDSLGMQMLHTYNRAQIAFNMRVVVQQPMAITRASMIIDPKYITQALNPKLIKQNVDDMLAHSGIAVWKDLGYYDINISRGLTQMIKQESTFSEKVTEVGLKPAEFADKATWAVLWGACKLQLKAQGVTDYAEIEKLFDEVIYKTQVVDSVLTKSQYMRDKGFFARSTASFMSEPTTTASMLLGEFDAYRADIRRGLTARQAWDNHKKTIGKTVLVYSVSAILLSMVTAAADAWRDDDDYQNIAEKWNEAFWQNLLDEISPFNKLPLINNVWELGKVALDTFTNLDVYGNLPDAAWAQWADTLSKAWSITQELSEGESNYTWYAAIYKYLQVASGLSGLPISAGTSEVVTVWNNVIGTFAPSLKIKDYELKPMTEIKYAVMDGYLTADEAADELMKQELVYDREEAEMTAELWAFLKDHKEYSDVSVSAYAKYKENCEGIDFGYFYQAWKYYSQTDADRDKDGEPISGSKKRKVLDFIYQMRLTPAQKKQLIKCFYK